MRAVAACLLLLALAAGCLSAGDGGDGGQDAAAPDGLLAEVVDGAIDHAAVAANIGEPVAMEHEGRGPIGNLPDHTHAEDHVGAHNLELVGYSALGVALGQNGFANFVLHEDGDRLLAFVASDGDDRAGLVIADVTDPAHMAPLGSLWIDGNNLQEVRVTPDGRYAVINVQVIPDADTPSYYLTPDGMSDCGVCILVVDVQDRAAPRVVSALPVELVGTHNMEFHTIGGQLYLFYVGQPLSVANPDVPGNRVGIARFQEVPGVGAMLVPVGSFMHPTTDDDGRSFPHDVTVAEHPLTGQTLAYVSHWDGGALVFDVSAPETAAAGTELARDADPAPSSALAIHWMVQEPQARRDGRVIAWSAPEIGTLDDGTGVIRAYDVSDPTRLVQLGTWTLPGNATITGAGNHYILSPHVAMPDQGTGLLAVAHYHAGVWVLDMSDPSHPQALGYYLPHGNGTAPYAGAIWWKKPNFDPAGYLPNAYMVRWHGGLLWASERGTGLYALRYTGPVPGPVL